MTSDSKEIKMKSQTKQPTCKYEKARRDRLNLFITELSTFLPEQNPSKSLSKIDVLEKIVHLIKDLLDDKEKLANKNCVDECLKEELKDLKATVSKLKARIVCLNKILKEANVSVPLDLEIQPFDSNFTPHLRYSHRKRALNCQSTQTEQMAPCQCESNESHKETHEKENEEECVGKLISFTKKLKPPLQEIQDNGPKLNDKTLRVPPLLPQIFVVPVYPAPRPAFTQLTFSNKRPISSYTDFKKIYTQQQEKLASKTRRRRQRQSGLRKKCLCQTVVLKKPDGTQKKIIKLCGNRSCRNKTKFRKIHEAAKQQLSEQAKAEKAKKINQVSSVDKNRVEVTNETEQHAPNNAHPMQVYPEKDLMVNLDAINTGDAKPFETKETCDNNTNNFEKKSQNGYDTENADYAFSNPTPDMSKKEKNSEKCYYPCTNYFSPMDASSSFVVDTTDLNYEHMKGEPELRNHTLHSNINSKSYDSSKTTRVEHNVGNPNNLILSINQKAAHLTENNSNKNIDTLSVNNVSHSIDSLNQKSSMETCVPPVLESFTNRNKLKQTEIAVDHVGSVNNSQYVHNKSKRINSNNETNDISNNGTGQVHVVDSNNMSSNSAVGSYSINSVIFSSKSYANETMHQMPHCTSSKHINTDMTYKNNTMFLDQRAKSDQKIIQSNEKCNTVPLSKQVVRKNLNFSFENLGSNVMSSEPSVEFGYNVSGDTTPLHPLLDSNYNTVEPHQPPFSYKNNNDFVGDTSYVETSQSKSSCYFESHPNALHFPYVPTNDKPVVSAIKHSEENKRKGTLKQKQETISNSSHDISQNIFEVNNKENSFDFLFGKQNSLNTPQKSKRKSDSCLISEKTFLLDEMKFHSEFSNDLFSLPGQVGGQNLECVSPTAAFLLTFPVVSSKQADLTDNIEPGNTITPIGNIESLSQDLPDFTFKSNIKGLFDPFYPSCIGTDTKLNFDFNAMDHVREDHQLNKANFSSCSEINNVVTSIPWSSNIINNDNSIKKKNSGDLVSGLNSNKAKVKSTQSIAASESTNSKCSQTLFSYPRGSDTVNNSKTLVNWMTSAGTQDDKKLSAKVNNSQELLPPVENSSLFFQNNQPAVASSFSVASFSNTTSSSNFVSKSSSLTKHDVPVCSTFCYYGDSKVVSHGLGKDKTHEQQPMNFNSNIEIGLSYNQNKSTSLTQSTHSYRSNNINETSGKSDSNVFCKNYVSTTKQENTSQGNISVDTTKSLFRVFPENKFEVKTNGKPCDQFVHSPVHHYSSNPVSTNVTCSTSSSFLSVSQLVDPGKSDIKHASNFVHSYITKSNGVKKEMGVHVEMKEPMIYDNKYNNYSTEALLSTPSKLQHNVSKVTSDSHPYRTVESKTRSKRKRSNSKTMNKINPVNFSSIYNVTSTTASNILYNTASYDPYFMGSTSAVENWNHNSLSKPSYNSPYSSLDTTTNKQNYFGSTSHENYVPLVGQNYFTPTTSVKVSQNQIPTFTCSYLSSQSHVTSSGYIPLSQHSYNKTKENVSSKHQSVMNSSSSGPKTGSTSVGTQVITSSFPQLSNPLVKPASTASHFSMNSSYRTESSFKTVQTTSTNNMMASSWNMSPLSSSSGSKLTVSSFMPIHTSTSTSNTLINFGSVPFTLSSTSLNLNSDKTSCPPFKSSFISSSSSLPISTLCSPSTLVTSSSAIHLSSNPVPITPITCTSVTPSPYSAGSLIVSHLHSSGPEQIMENLYTPASSTFHSSVSTSLPPAPRLILARTQNSNRFCTSLNTSIISSISYSSPNTLSTTLSTKTASLNTPKSSSSSSYGTVNTPISSATLYSSTNIPNFSSNLSVSLNTPISSSVLPYSSINTSKICTTSSKSSLNTEKTSCSVSNSSIKTKTLSYTSINTSKTSSLRTPMITSSLSHASHHVPITSYASLGTATTSTSPYYTSIGSSCQTYASPNPSIVTSCSPSYISLQTSISSSYVSQASHTIPTTSSNISYGSIHTPSSSVLSYTSLNPPNTSGLSYAPTNSSSLSYTSLSTPLSSASLPYASFNNPIITSSISYASLDAPTNSSRFSYPPVDSSLPSSSPSSTPGGNVPYSSMSLYPPVTSSVTDFNLSTIFPEINIKNQSHNRSAQMYGQHNNYQRSIKPRKS